MIEAREEWRTRIVDFGQLRQVRRQLTESLLRAGACSLEVGDAELIFTELAANSLRYSGGKVEAVLAWVGESPAIVVVDEGAAFAHAPDRLPPSVNETGRGLYLVKTLAREFTVEHTRNGNRARAILQPVGCRHEACRHQSRRTSG